MTNSTVASNLQLADQYAFSATGYLRAALGKASPLEAHCLMPLIAQAQELANDLAALQFAINAKE